MTAAAGVPVQYYGVGGRPVDEAGMFRQAADVNGRRVAAGWANAPDGQPWGVSTILLAGMPYLPPGHPGFEPPYESMIKGPHGEATFRHASLEDAEAGHAEALAVIGRGEMPAELEALARALGG